MNNIKIDVPLQKLVDGYIYDYFSKNIWNPYKLFKKKKKKLF